MNTPTDHNRDEAEQDLRAFLLRAVRQEHPEWIRADGHCPECREYQQKISHLFDWTRRIRSAA